MELSHPIFSFEIGKLIIDIKPEAVIQFIIVVLLGILAWLATRNFELKPKGKRQVVVEYIYTSLKSLISSNLGEKYYNIIPFIGTIAAFIFTMNMLGLIGIPSPTKNLSVTISLALISFVFIQSYAIKQIGIGHYFGGFFKPMAPMLPLNIMERILLPVSLSLRLFGNILAASFLVELVYTSLSGIAWIAQIGLPVPLHAYFDVFDGTIQTIIFTMLTMVNVKVISEH